MIHMENRIYSPEEQDIVAAWYEKWLEFSGFLNEITGTNEPPYSPPIPSDSDELNYIGLRFWFLEHEEEFVPLWKYYDTRIGCSAQNISVDDMIKISQIDDKYFYNPFRLFYEPKDLSHLAKSLEFQCSVDIWEPSEKEVHKARLFMIELIMDLRDFIYSAAGEIPPPLEDLPNQDD